MEYVICSESGNKITKDMIIGCISDTYKSINGIRPRHINFSDMCIEELGNMLTELQSDAEESWKREVKWEREQRKVRRRSEKRYQAIRKSAKSLPQCATFTLGEIFDKVM